MAMTQCKECKKDVSTNAKTCPHCGIQNPAVSSGEAAKGCLGLVFLSIIIAVAMASCDDDSSSSSPNLSDVECEKTLSCLAEKHIISAGAICQSPIQKMSKFSYEWTDGFTTPRFSHYRWNSQPKGVITFIGDQIKMQNGFGAWAHYTYECDFDTTKQSVIDVRATQGRIE